MSEFQFPKFLPKKKTNPQASRRLQLESLEDRYCPASLVDVNPLGVVLPEGDTGTTTDFVFNLTRSGDTTATTTVDFDVTGSGGNPADASDFVGGAFPTGTITFNPGDTTATITVQVNGDIDVEPTEAFEVELANPTNGTLGNALATGLILNDDASVSIASIDATRSEGDAGQTDFTFTVTRSGDISSMVVVDYSVSGSNGNSADGSDFVGGMFPTGAVTFNPNETIETITIPVNGDTSVELDEKFTVTLSPPTGVSVGNGSADGLIENDDSSLLIASVNAFQAEGDSGTTSFTFVVVRTGDLSTTATVDFDVTGSGTDFATADDFVGGMFPSDTLTFNPTDAIEMITIPVQGDTEVELNEQFFVTLSGASGVTISNPMAVGLILNDDTSVSIANTDATKLEGDVGPTDFSFTVTRTGDLSGMAVVSYAVAGTGTDPADAMDFTGGVFPSGMVTFNPGDTTATITVQVNGDTDLEPDESFEVTVTPLAGVSGGPDSAVGLIINDEAALSIVPSNPSQAEGDGPGATNFTYTVVRSGDVSDMLTVDYSVTGIGAEPAEASDFVGAAFPTGTVTLNPGDVTTTITIPVQGDTIVEADETFAVTLTPPTGVPLGNASATGLIINDDAATLSITAPVITETDMDQTVTFTVTLDVDVEDGFTVAHTLTLGTAEAADLTVETATPITFVGNGGETQDINVTIVGDNIVEADETFTITLGEVASTSAQQIASITTGASATATIIDDDTTTLTVEDVSGAEDGPNLTFVVTLSEAVEGGFTVDYDAASGTAISGNDYTPTSGTLTFAGTVGETQAFVVDPTADTIVEADETFTI
ncbi:MAG: beta strand repeat-containing protein, partial [Gemmataceae bacterium]